MEPSSESITAEVFLHTDKSFFFVHRISYLVFSSSLLMQKQTFLFILEFSIVPDFSVFHVQHFELAEKIIH